MPRFVLLTHDHPVWHWDFMLERDGVLRTWRLDADPLVARHVVATPLPDHRLAYLEYEGPVSQQRGHVQRVDGGEYELLEETSQGLKLALHGERLRGDATLTIDSDGAMWFQHDPVPAK